MLRKIALATALLFTGSVTVFAAPKDDVAAAAKKLGDTSYSWKQTSENLGQGAGGQGGGRGRGGFGGGGNLEGKMEKGGFTMVTRTFGENTSSAYLKDGKGAVQTQDGWQSLSELSNAEGPGRFQALLYQNFQSPDKQAADLAMKSGDLKMEGDAITGMLTADGAKALMAIGGRGGAGGQAAEVKDPKGTVKFWLKDGNLAKYEYTVQGTRTFNDQEFAINRKTTIELSNVGNTKVEVPADVKAKVN